MNRSARATHLIPTWLKGRRAPSPATRTEKFLVVVASAVFLTLLFADAVSTAPDDVTMTKSSFDVAPMTSWAPRDPEK